MEQRNIAKASLLYDYLDASAFYRNEIAKDSRSRMNVPFFLRDESLNEAFLVGAKAHGLLQLKGHKSVGACAHRSTTRCRSKAYRRWLNSCKSSRNSTRKRARNRSLLNPPPERGRVRVG